MAHFFAYPPHTSSLDDGVESIESVQQEHSHDNDDAEVLIQCNSNSSQENSDPVAMLISKFRISRINFAYLSGRLKCKLDVKCKKRICAVVSFLSLIVIVSVCISLGYYAVFVLKPAPVIDKSYRAFRIPNHKASLAYGTLQSAKKYNNRQVSMNQLQWAFNLKSFLTSRNELASNITGEKKSISRSTSAGYDEEQTTSFKSKFRKKRSSVFQTQFIPTWRMQVVFMTGSDENIFTPGRLQTIHDIEKKIVTKKNYSNFCFKDSRLPMRYNSGIIALKDCAPLNSLLTYFFPSKDDYGNIRYDGIGDNMVNLNSALTLAMQSTHFYYYVDEKVNKSYMKSQLLRTEVLFGAPLNGFNDIYTGRVEQNKMFKEFVVSYIDLLSKASTKDVTVLYGGQEIFDYEVEMAFWCDVRLAFYALIAIFLLMLILTSGSVWLTVWGLISILLSCLLAIFFYRVVFKIVGLGILNGAAAFVIIGIGVDDVFVFINVFCQADHEMDARSRILYTLKIAGKATFFTSLTTAAAFAANIASMIPAIHDFGLFMSLIVANCWITVVLVMPPVLYIWYICIRRCEEKIAHFICCCLPTCKSFNLTLPADIANFLGHIHGIHSSANVSEPTMSTDDVADEPLLSMDVSTPLSAANNDDVDMLWLGQEPLLSPSVDVLQQDNHLGLKLQALLYYYMALPFIKARWFILGISILLLGISIGLMTQLKPSTKPPQFFRKDMNMQKFMDLKSKFSSFDTLQCFDCSAMYSVGQQENPYRPTQNVPQPTSYRPAQNTPQPSDQPHLAAPTENNLPVVTKSTEKSATSIKPLITKARQPTIGSPTLRPHDYPTNAWTNFHPPPSKVSKSTSSIIVTSDAISTPEYVPVGYDACKNADCSHMKDRPLLELGTTVYVMVGVKDFKWSSGEVEHVISDDTGTIEFDPAFSSAFNFSNPGIFNELRHLCMLCTKIASNLQLVRNGSAQCLPDSILYHVKSSLFKLVPECKGLSAVNYIYGRKQPAYAIGGLTLDGSAIAWLAFAFESTTSKSLSYFEAYKHYQNWEDFISDLKKDMEPSSSLRNILQTSEFWPEVLMEVVAVNSAIYSVVLSMVICMVAVAVFTRHLILLFIIFVSIMEMVCLVVAIFYILGWEIGGVEAVSLSILVGSSVDYCVHLVEGYVLAADACPMKDNAVEARRWRTGAAFNHIGISVMSSALTTIVAAIPLTQTKIQPFAKFGQIIAINTSVCITYSLTVCVALLSTIAPAYFKPTWKSTLKSFIVTAIFVGLAVLTLFIISKAGVDIPGPNGGRLFSKMN